MSSSFSPLVLNFDGNPAPKIRKYNTWEVNFTWTDSANVPVDLSYYNGHMQIRKNSQATSYTSLTTLNGGVTLSSSGTIKLKLSDTITSTMSPGKYVYDLILSDSSEIDTNGEGMSTFTLITGEIIVEDGVTRES